MGVEKMNELNFCQAKAGSLMHSADIVFILDSEDKVSDLCVSNMELLCYPAEHYLGKKLLDVVVLHDRGRVEEALEKCRSGEICKIECSREIEGKEKWFAVVMAPITVEGEYRGAAIVVNDVTDKKRLEEAYRTIVENTIHGLIIYQEGRVVFANHAAERIMGYRAEELTGEKLREIVHPDHREWAWEMAEKRLKGEKVPERFRIKVFRKDGRVIWLECMANVAKYDGRDAIVVSFIDITEEKKMERELGVYRNIVENVNDVIVVVDEKGVIEHVTPSCERVLGYSVDERLGKSIFDNIHPDDKKLAAETFEAVKDGKMERASLTVRYVKKDGEIIWLDVAASVVDSNGERQGILVLRDVTEKIRMQNLIISINKIMKAITREKNTEDLLEKVRDELNKMPECVEAAIYPDGSGEEEIVDEVRKFRVYRSYDVNGLRSYYFPMVVNDEVKGVLTLRFNRELMEDEIDLLQTLANDVAFAIKSIELEEMKERAYMQIEENVTKFAILVDGIKNPLTVIRGLVELKVDDAELSKKLIEQVEKIYRLTKEIEKSWKKSEELRGLLREKKLTNSN